MIERREAVQALREMNESGILSPVLESVLDDIAICIEAEEDLGIHIWGVDDEEFLPIMEAEYMPAEEPSPELKAKIEKIINRYGFRGCDEENQVRIIWGIEEE